jgi:hypothetical protein
VANDTVQYVCSLWFVSLSRDIRKMLQRAVSMCTLLSVALRSTITHSGFVVALNNKLATTQTENSHNSHNSHSITTNAPLALFVDVRCHSTSFYHFYSLFPFLSFSFLFFSFLFFSFCFTFLEMK